MQNKNLYHKPNQIVYVVCFCVYKAQISGEGLQVHWTSCFYMAPLFLRDHNRISTRDINLRYDRLTLRLMHFKLRYQSHKSNYLRIIKGHTNVFWNRPYLESAIFQMCMILTLILLSFERK